MQLLLILRLAVTTIIILAFIPHQNEASVPPYTSIVAPVTKHTDSAKPLYSVQIITSFANMQHVHENLIIDVDAPFIFHNCLVRWFEDSNDGCSGDNLCAGAVSCEEDQCTDVRTTYSYDHNHATCQPETNSSTLPGSEFCTCPVNVVTPATGSCNQGLLNYEDDFTLNASDGKNVYTGLYGRYANAACANSSSSFTSYPANVTGIMALSSSPYALPAYFYPTFGKTLALCLPSTLSGHGVLFVGDGPYYLLPQSDIDVRSLLTYTPLLKYQDSFGYFIGVNSIVIEHISINVPVNSSITKISTIVPYTTLRTDIYNRLVWGFSKVTKRIPHAKPVAHFGVCFSTFKYGTKVGMKFPDIDLSLQDGKNWTISMANSIKQVTKDVACLAFVDGGATSEPAIVIGTFQFEDNFLEFDLKNSAFGFSSSLLDKHTSCSNFNFTLTKSP